MNLLAHLDGIKNNQGPIVFYRLKEGFYVYTRDKFTVYK